MATPRCLPLLSSVVGVVIASAVQAQSTFVNWENPHVHPLDLSPDRTKLFAVNTADDRLEVFDPTSASLTRLFQVPVGLDPVSVRARTNNEVWVVNHISDSVSVVDLATRNVIATLKCDDEPADVVFAGSPQRAFVSCSQANTVLVFDPANLAAAPTRIDIDGEDPRALAVSPDGSKVYCAIFESGNSSTILGGGGGGGVLGFPPNVVNDPTGPWAGVNPPPNSGNAFNPPINLANPPPPKVGLIVKKGAFDRWTDDNNGDWTDFVTGAKASASGRQTGWDLSDNDVAVIETATLNVTYARHLMNVCMAIAVNPVNGEVTVVGTDGTNETRYEPIVKGKFLRVEIARVDPNGPGAIRVKDLNPHLTYATSNVPPAERNKSIGDPRGIAWNATGTRAYVTGMGSNNVVVVDAIANRAGLAPTIEVGEGPTGIVIDEARARLYVLDKFAASISVVSTASETETLRVPFYDPSPLAIKVGRKHLYDTRKNSGLGQIACASCHVDARVDRLAWDLGDPSGAMAPVTGQNLGAGIPGLNTGFLPYHPMKGPMTTQTLQDIITKEPLHWRGDRSGIEAFNGAFLSLQGGDQSLTTVEMQQYKNFLATIAIPPNPNRNFDNTLPTNLTLPGHFTIGRFAPAGQPLPSGDAVAGLNTYRTAIIDQGFFKCVTCHTLPLGMGTNYTRSGATFVPLPLGPNGERHHALISADGSTNISIKIPQLRTEYEKTGFNTTQLVNHSGFGLLHDGSVDSLERFVGEPVFTVTSDQQIANLVAFLLSFSGSDLPQGSTTFNQLEPPGDPSQDTHAAVGVQTTLVSGANPAPGQLQLIGDMIALADANKVGLVVKGLQAGIVRGYTYAGGGTFQSDRAAEILTGSQLQLGAAPGSELTYTLVPLGTQTRIGIDRDQDGIFDRDEIDGGTDPANADSHSGVPGTSFCFGNGSGTPCPCGNNAVGTQEGCVHAFGSGSRLTASGIASLANDTFVLSGSQMPAGSLCLYVQGTQRENGGVGSTFGQGLRCAGGVQTNLGAKVNLAGSSQYPAAGDPSVSAIGAITTPGSVRTYQVIYRSLDTLCSGATFNASNGWEVTWRP